MSTLYRRGDSRYWWYKERIPGRRKPLYMSLHIEDKRLAKLRQQQLNRILTELRLPQLDWSFMPALERDAQLREIVFRVCADLGITLTLRANVTVEQALKEFEAYSVTKKTPKSHNTDWGRITGFLRWSGVVYLHEIRPSQIQDYFIHRVQNESVQKSTANHCFVALKAFLNWCIKREMLRENPANKVERFKVATVPQHYLKDAADIVRLLEAAKRLDRGMYPMVVAAVFTGCRLGELMALEWPDVDLDGRRVLIKDKPELGLRTKSGRLRVIPLHPDLAIVLRPMWRPFGFVFFPERKERKYTSPLYRRWKEIRKASGMPETTWYSLRRTFCSHLAMSGVSLLKIQVWAGHSDPRITQEHYAHLTPQYDPQIEQILHQNEAGGYDLVTFEPTVEKAETHYPLQDSGLAADDKWRGRRGSNPQPTARQAATLTN